MVFNCTILQITGCTSKR